MAETDYNGKTRPANHAECCSMMDDALGMYDPKNESDVKFIVENCSKPIQAISPNDNFYERRLYDVVWDFYKLSIDRFSQKRGKIEMSDKQDEIKPHCEVLTSKDTLRIVLPDGMTPRSAIEYLERKEREDEQDVTPHHSIPCFPLDGAVNFQRALREVYGWTEAVPTPGWWGSNPPVMVGVPVSPTETIQVPWGRIVIPGISGFLSTGLEGDPSPAFVVSGKVKNKHSKQVLDIVNLTRKYITEKSIYKGRAIRLNFDWKRASPPHFHPLQHAPKFMDLAGVRPTDLIFNSDVQQVIKDGLFTPITQSAACRKLGVPLKRGVLLEGKFGVGKTLTANVTALLASQNGWTFIYLDSIEDLARGLAAASQYSPAVLFVEDVDRVMRGERSITMDSILNILDGVDTKKVEVITVMTTNDIEVINPALLRPGRIDMAISINPPDANAAVRLVKHYSNGMLAPDTNFEKLGLALEGNIPATIREVLDRSKLSAIARLADEGVDVIEEGIEGRVREDDVINCHKAMEMHNRLLQPKQPDKRTMAEQFGDAMGSKVGEVLSAGLTALVENTAVALDAANRGTLKTIDSDVIVETADVPAKG